MKLCKSLRELAIDTSLYSQMPRRAVARQLKINESTLRLWLKQYKDTAQTTKKKPPGRPRKLNGEINSYLGTVVSSNKTVSSKAISTKIKEKYGIGVSKWTVRRSLKRLGYTKKKAVRKPMLTKTHISKRLKWCQENQSRTWGNVIFSDECTFQLYRNTVLYWTKGSQRVVKETKKHGPKVHVWGAIHGKRKFPLYLFTQNMDSILYQHILKSNMLPIYISIKNTRLVFQMDNDPKHKSKSTQNFLASNSIKVLSWPSQSPDLNPMENVWADLKRRVELRNPKNEQELRGAIEKEWQNVNTENLVESMKRRLKECIDANGGHTSY